MNASSLKNAFVPLPGGAQAVYNSTGLQYYRHPDWLGSSRLSTTSGRAKYYDVAYAPFGEPYAGSGTTDLSFTGQNQDTEVGNVPGGAGGLYDFLYREHSPVQGRWLSPDPSGLAAANPSDPQSWNRYAYTGNRPLNSVDSSGLVTSPCFEDWGLDCDYPGPPDPCDPTVDPLCIFPPILPPGFPGVPPGDYPPPQRKGGVWPGNRTPGLPTGLGTSPFDLASLLGLSPGTQCGDFGVCNPIGNEFEDTATLGAAVPVCVAQPELCIAGIIGIGIVVYGPQIIQTARDIGEFTSKFSKCLNQFIEDTKACNDAYPPGPARDQCYKAARQKFDLCKAGGTIQ